MICLVVLHTTQAWNVTGWSANAHVVVRFGSLRCPYSCLWGLRSGVLVGGTGWQSGPVVVSWSRLLWYVLGFGGSCTLLYYQAAQLLLWPFHRLFCFIRVTWAPSKRRAMGNQLFELLDCVAVQHDYQIHSMPSNHNWCFIGLEVSGMMLTRQHVEYSIMFKRIFYASSRSTGPDTILLC